MPDDMGSFRVDIELENPARLGTRLAVRNASATDDVVFGEPDDLVLLGARSLEGLNLRIDSVSKRLTDAGPIPLAARCPDGTFPAPMALA